MAQRVESVPILRAHAYMPPPLSVILIGLILVSAASARAQQPADGTENKNAKPTVLSLEWEPVNEPAAAETSGDAKAAGSNRAYFYAEQVLSPLISGGKKKEKEERYSRPVALTAKLRDPNGAPLPNQQVGFSLETTFGTLLQFGKVPTDAQGKAKLVLRDRRCGVRPVQAVYGGDSSLKTSYSLAKVDFGACPAAGLPAEGVLITPYATAPISLAVVFFYGTMWVVFAYSVGYLLLWRLRRAGNVAGAESFDVPVHGS